MRLQAVVAVVFTLFITSCSVKLEPAKTEAGPTIKEGFYSVDNPNGKNVPLVSIRIDGGNTYAYSLLSYVCEGKVTSSFDQSGITFSDSSSSAGGPGVSVLGKGCDITSDIRAKSDNSIQVTVKLNGVPQPAYILSRIDKKTFAGTLRTLGFNSDHFTIDRTVCLRVLGDECAGVQLAAK
jgi:hypothetical protein